MKTWIRRMGKFLFLAMPVIFGLYGFVWVEKLPFVQSLFNCVCMYCLNYQDEPLNMWIEAARWLAPLATASGLVFIVRHFKNGIHNLVAYCTGRSVAVFGPQEEQAILLEELGYRGIAMGEKPVKAHQYIFLGTERENLDFYELYHRRLANRDVYIKCCDLPAQASTGSKLHLFCPEETAARYFWKEYCPYKLSFSNSHQFRITIIGFDKLGKEMLLSALQNNIFSRDQQITYHVLGEEKGFRSVYHQLNQLSDPVFFHSEPWYDHMELISESEMVIITNLPDQLSVLRDLTLAFPGKNFHVLATRQQEIALLKAQSAQINVFDWQACSRKKDAILGTLLYEQAMRINLRYAHLYNGVAETEENKQKEWDALDTFLRYSNISSADYHDIRKIMLSVNGWTAPLNEAQLEELAELEHIRWCRYHFLNNWMLGVPKNGATKDKKERIHKSLVAYEKLSREEQEKDHEVIDILFSLSEEAEKISKGLICLF